MLVLVGDSFTLFIQTFYSHIHADTRHSHHIVLHCEKTTTNNILIRKAVWPPFNVFSSTVFLLVYLVIGVTLFSELSVFTKFFPSLSRHKNKTKKNLSLQPPKVYIHINIYFRCLFNCNSLTLYLSKCIL